MLLKRLLLAAFIGMTANSGYAIELGSVSQEIQIPEGMEVSIFPIPGPSSRLVLILTDKHQNRELRSFNLKDSSKIGWRQEFQMALDQEIQFFDVAKFVNGYEFIAYHNPRLLSLNMSAREFEPLVNLGSFFGGKIGGQLSNVALAEDLNGDNLDDLLLPNFDGWQVTLQSLTRSFEEPQTIGPAPSMRAGSRYVAYSAAEVFKLDHNMDGLIDAAFWSDGEFLVHYLKDSGRFEEAPIPVDLGIEGLSDDGNISLGIGTNRDDEQRIEKVLSGFEDLNADGIADLIIHSFLVDGIFGTKTRIDVHFGKSGAKGHVEYPPQADTSVLSKGIQFGSDQLDIDKDGASEIMVLSTNVTIPAMVRALVARSVVLDINIYRISKKHFPEVPSITRRVTASIDFSSGKLSIPAVLLADVTGDGLKDMLVQSGDDELSIYAGNGKLSLFSETPVAIKLSLPATLAALDDAIQVVDLDEDGRDELVMLDDSQDQKKVVLVTFHGQ